VRRRLTFAILAAVVVTLLVAGAGTLLLARLGARQQTEHDLRAQAKDISTSITDAESGVATRVLNNLRRALNLEGIQVIRFGPGGHTVDPLPNGVTVADLDIAALRKGGVVSGNHGSLVYAAAPAAATTADILPVVVVTRNADPVLRRAAGWFLIASIALGALFAWVLSRRLARPLQDAELATRRIATGDLSTRIPDAGGNDELSSLGRSINSMAETLERSRGVERQFLLSVSHDLRTPLTSIRGYAEAIADGAIADPADAGNVILAESRRLERLVRDLLDLAKLESREFSFEQRPVDLSDIATGTADGFRPEADDAAVTISVIVGDPAVVAGDPDRLAQVTANLVENALKFATSRVRIDVNAREGWGLLDVVDDGPGIAPEDLPHVFERLYVSRHEPRRKEAGSGLGLAIVRELVTAMGGQVRASAAPGGGACLSIALPLASDALSSVSPSS
jgi:two-component system sensor histidine kinase BaeS